jgi:hypothetical protein
MELDELKASWQRLDRRVQVLTEINRSLMMDAVLRKARWRLAPLVSVAAGFVIVGICFVVVFGAFWVSHLDMPVVLIPCIAAQIMGVTLIVFGVGRLVLARRIDLTRPVVEIQRPLASLQRSFHAVWVAGCLLAPAFLISVTVAIGPRFGEHIPGIVLAQLIMWGVAGLAPVLLYIASRRRRGKLAARMDAFLTSDSTARARTIIKEIEEFTRS